VRIHSANIKWIIAAFLLTPCFVSVSGQQRGDPAKVLGDWTGESICVGNNPGCNDEKVIYHLSRSAADPNTVTLAADKVVDGKPDVRPGL